MASPTEANKALVRELLEALNRGNRDRAREIFAENATWSCPPSLPWPAEYHGRDAIFDQYFAVDEDLFETGVSSYDLEILQMTAEDDRVCVEMRHRGLGKNGAEYTTDHCVIYVIQDRQITHVREYVDSLYLSKLLLD